MSSQRQMLEGALAKAIDRFIVQFQTQLKEKIDVLNAKMNKIEKQLTILNNLVSDSTNLEAVLSQRNLENLLEFLRQVKPETFFDNQVLKQSIILSLIQQLTVYLSTEPPDSALSIKWIKFALLEIDESDKMFKFVPPLMTTLKPLIQQYSSNESIEVNHFIRKYTKQL